MEYRSYTCGFPSVRLLGATIAFAIVVAACGDSGTTVTTLETLDSSSSETLAPTAPPTTATTDEQQGPERPLPESDYPDVVVADLAGGEVNLKELALEQNPVLLWFWAPH